MLYYVYIHNWYTVNFSFKFRCVKPCKNLLFKVDVFFRWLPTLLQFTIVCRQYKLDGFVIEIPEEYHHNDIHVSQVFEIYSTCISRKISFENKLLRIQMRFTEEYYGAPCNASKILTGFFKYLYNTSNIFVVGICKDIQENSKSDFG